MFRNSLDEHFKTLKTFIRDRFDRFCRVTKFLEKCSKLFWCPVAFENVTNIFFTFSVLYHLCSPAQDLPRQTQSYLRCCCFCSGQGDPAIWKCIFLHPMTINNCVIVTPIWTEEGNWVIFHLATHIKSQSEANCCLLVHLLPFKASGNKNWEVWSSNIQKCWLVTSLLKRNEIHLEPKQSVLLKKVFGKITFKSVYLVQMLVVSSGDRRRDGQVAVRGEMVLGLDAGGPVEVHTCMANTQTLHCNVNILRIKTSSWQKDLDYSFRYFFELNKEERCY